MNNRVSKIPADGILISANRFFSNEAILTGESVPVEKSSNDWVFMGTTVSSGQAVMKAEKHLPEFYEAVGLKMPKKPATVKNSRTVPLLNLTMCVTDSELTGADSFKEYFEVLEQLRKKANTQGGSGIHLDHRKARKKKRAVT